MVKSHTYIVHGSENMVHVMIDLGRSLKNIVHGSRKDHRNMVYMVRGTGEIPEIWHHYNPPGGIQSG